MGNSPKIAIKISNKNGKIVSNHKLLWDAKSLGVQGDVTKVNWLGILNTPWTSLYLISRCDVPWLCGLNLL